MSTKFRRTPLKVFLVCGARPNFMKVAPVIKEMRKYPSVFSSFLVHTGQHYDYRMSDIFFKELELPEPDYFLGVGSGSHARQTARVMVEFEKVCLKDRPGLVIVVGDINSTLACSLVAAKLLVPVAHIEAGLRSFDRTMPEEINRIVTDSLSSLLFTTCREARANLMKEGVAGKKIFFAGNVMIDTLKFFTRKALALDTLARYGLDKKGFALLTLHRPSNVDNRQSFGGILKALKKVSSRIPVFFPVHPRTKKQIELFGMRDFFAGSGIKTTEPLGYLDFLNLTANAKFVLTDSGGIQEETTYLGVPCLTLRKNTERPVTVAEGTNTLVGDNASLIIKEAFGIIDGRHKKGRIPRLWDGRASQRIVKILKNI